VTLAALIFNIPSIEFPATTENQEKQHIQPTANKEKMENSCCWSHSEGKIKNGMWISEDSYSIANTSCLPKGTSKSS
jgi:hypothetical protein